MIGVLNEYIALVWGDCKRLRKNIFIMLEQKKKQESSY